MGFRQADSEGRGGFARVWSVDDKGKYSTVRLSTSKKTQDEDGNDIWVTDFQDGFVKFIGSAHTKINELEIPTNAKGDPKGLTIQITSCEVSTYYNPKTERTTVNYAVYAFDVPDDDDSKKTATKKSVAKKSTAKAKTKKTASVDEDTDDLPFD